MIYLLDTNTCIQYLTGRSENVSYKFKTTPRQNIGLCDVVKAELYYGACRSAKKEQNLALYELFFSQYISLPFEGKSAKVYGEIRAELSRLGIPIGPYDFQIAAIALANNLILVTHNTQEFKRIQNLKLEDWEIL
ncbi:type II toxin-antitoxin system tRNA(fMet)-specific endonuclease VapC [Oscillatoria acuminata]|uniref:Putative nucleic acid-binding protein, contains PIN domain n=1 Tax=Oscillatoria acuminata PCC 6304 TaxID=56110 RepID=K9TC77_9CYAN|nr:type II toxin-antitoxin system VapC family toxin [Oscillatoria acuminata]AFY80140.1 putative nucleic acid-binding protein, contains PIN domain [Oscillatoria acuminata PCC 6304]